MIDGSSTDGCDKGSMILPVSGGYLSTSTALLIHTVSCHHHELDIIRRTLPSLDDRVVLVQDVDKCL